MNEWINEKLLPPILKFVNTKAITALRNGMLYTMPFSIVGSNTSTKPMAPLLQLWPFSP